MSDIFSVFSTVGTLAQEGYMPQFGSGLRCEGRWYVSDSQQNPPHTGGADNGVI